MQTEYNSMEINKIYNENCLDTMARMPDDFIDLTVTSPPYDNLRTYNGYTFDFEPIARELYRVTKPGGVVVWVVGDATVNGSETGTSFRQALYFKDVCGFNVETMIYLKNGTSANGNMNFYLQGFEYMFLLVKGVPKSINHIRDRANKLYGKKNSSAGRLNKEGCYKKGESFISERFGRRYNYWKYNPTNEGIHPAPFPEKLASDHIYSWSNEGDLVYDPFMGSGTTAKMAHLLKRNWIGSEISSEYVELANKRLKPYLQQLTMF